MRYATAVLTVVLAMIAAPPVATQGELPPDCQCSFVSDGFPKTVVGIGTLSCTASCNYATQGGVTGCQVIGTITYTYNQNNWTFANGFWGVPLTTIASANQTFTVTHPANFAACGTGLVSSWMRLIGADQSELAAYRIWNCVGAQ